MRAVGDWAWGFVRILINVVILFLVYLPGIALFCIAWLIYFVGVTFGLGLFVAWGIFTITSSLWVGLGAGTFMAVLYVYTVMFIDSRSRWPSDWGNDMFDIFIEHVPWLN